MSEIERMFHDLRDRLAAGSDRTALELLVRLYDAVDEYVFDLKCEIREAGWRNSDD